MKIAFVNYTEMDYDINTPHTAPLGGSESAMCYLAGELARLGHEVTLFNQKGRGEKIGGVVHWSREMIKQRGFLSEVEVMVVQNTPDAVPELKQNLPGSAKLIFWTQHAHDQKAIVEPLQKSGVIEAIDAFVFISHWQMESYLSQYPITREKCTILRNAVAPSFLNLFKDPDDIMAHKTKPILAYTSVPFRGLELLLTIFPLIKQQVPKAELKIYSSMQVYQMGKEQESRDFGQLYDQLARLEGVNLIGSLPQNELAQAMREVIVLAYPNTFAETACTSAMEAMVAGVHVVSSYYGALPETVLPYGDLVSVEKDKEYVDKFVEYIVKYLSKLEKEREVVKTQLGNQVLLFNKSFNWSLRAKEWERWLNS